MKNLFCVIFCLAALVSAALSQTKSNDRISRQISDLRSEKIFTLSFDQAGNSSKLMAVAENFADAEAARAGLMAMNFAVGFIYPGNSLAKSPESIKLTFWAMSKKPRFAENQEFNVNAGKELVTVGSGRYSARPRENMEYLNYEISRADLAKIAAAGDVRFTLGGREFTFTRQHLKIFADLLAVSTVEPDK